MAAYQKQILCINKERRFSPDERITHVGGRTPGGLRWKETVDQVISNILAGDEYFVMKGYHKVKVEIAERQGRAYIKTENDQDTADNLLSLPECP